MKLRQRIEWIMEWMRANGRADVLNRDLVDAYTSATGARYAVMPYGANKCPQLGRDLAWMAKLGYAKRCATGIGDGLCYQGFPRWVWSYTPGRYSNELRPNEQDKARP